MNNSELFYGSICVTDLLDHANKKHSGFTKGQNGKIYAAINVWKNDEPDKFGNTISIQLQSVKEKRDQEGKIYLGNAKKADNTPKPIADKDVSGLSINADIPQQQRKSGHYSEVEMKSDISDNGSDLPF